MKRMGILGGMSAQATMDFEARVHRAAQRLIPQEWNREYPPMIVCYCGRARIDVTGGREPIAFAHLPGTRPRRPRV